MSEGHEFEGAGGIPYVLCIFGLLFLGWKHYDTFLHPEVMSIMFLASVDILIVGFVAGLILITYFFPTKKGAKN